MDVQVVGPVCLYQPKPSRPKREATPIDSREQSWRDLKPLSIERAPIKRDGFVAPLGALKGIEHFIARVETIKRLTDQQERDAATSRVLVEQDMEMATIIDEFRANGFSAVSLSSSSLDDDDDELEAANIAEAHLKMVPYAYGIKGYTEPDEFGTQRPIYRSAEEAAPLMRRVQYEREQAASGPALAVGLILNEDGSVGATTQQPWMAKTLGPTGIKELGQKIKAVTRLDGLDERRARVAYYKAVGSLLYGVATGWTPPEQSMDDLGIEDMEKQDEAKSGPQEIGLHTLTSDYPEEYGPTTAVLAAPSVEELNSWYEEAV